MAETMRVVMNSFWSWLGTFLIIAAVAEGLGGLFRASWECQSCRDKGHNPGNPGSASPGAGPGV
jgi:hypothetical protein